MRSNFDGTTKAHRSQAVQPVVGVPQGQAGFGERHLPSVFLADTRDAAGRWCLRKRSEKTQTKQIVVPHRVLQGLWSRDFERNFSELSFAQSGRVQGDPLILPDDCSRRSSTDEEIRLDVAPPFRLPAKRSARPQAQPLRYGALPRFSQADDVATERSQSDVHTSFFHVHLGGHVASICEPIGSSSSVALRASFLFVPKHPRRPQRFVFQHTPHSGCVRRPNLDDTTRCSRNCQKKDPLPSLKRHGRPNNRVCERTLFFQ